MLSRKRSPGIVRRKKDPPNQCGLDGYWTCQTDWRSQILLYVVLAVTLLPHLQVASGMQGLHSSMDLMAISRLIVPSGCVALLQEGTTSSCRDPHPAASNQVQLTPCMHQAMSVPRNPLSTRMQDSTVLCCDD
jgi:hypothetical protein